MRIAVLGAGVIGVTTAYYLSERGHSVTIIDRADDIASGASGRNGGQLSYSFTDAMAIPALLGKMPRIVAGLNPAFYFRPPIDLDLIRWGLAFLSQCTTTKNQKNTLKILQLALRSGELSAVSLSLSLSGGGCERADRALRNNPSTAGCP